MEARAGKENNKKKKDGKHENRRNPPKKVLGKHIKTTDKLCAGTADIVIDVVVVVAVGRGGDGAVAAAADRAMIARDPSRAG